MTKKVNDDSNYTGTRNFIEENIGTYLQPLQTGFDGNHSWLEVDLISIQRNASGDFKGSAKGYRKDITGRFMPAVIYVEHETLAGILALLGGEISDRDGRWYTDRYPKQRNARAVREGTDHYDS